MPKIMFYNTSLSFADTFGIVLQCGGKGEDP